MDIREYEYLTPVTGGYLKSRSTRDCRLSNRRRPHIRVKAPIGVTGGYVDGRQSVIPIVKVREATPQRTGARIPRAEKIARLRANVGRLAQ